MNAKITITVPMAKVPARIAGMLNDVSNELESSVIEVGNIAKAVYDHADIMKQIELIDEQRKKLALLDANLDDCYSVLVGLVNYKTKKEGVDATDAAQ